MQFWIDLAQQTATINVLLFSFLGTLAGIIAAAIPGFTILMAVVLVFPFTFAMTPLEGLATIIGVFILAGALYAFFVMGSVGTGLKVLLIGLLIFTINPVGAHAIAKGAYKSGVRPEKEMEIDDYGRDFNE